MMKIWRADIVVAATEHCSPARRLVGGSSPASGARVALKDGIPSGCRLDQSASSSRRLRRIAFEKSLASRAAM